VFELVDSGCVWAEATSIGDHALFLGPTCSKAVHVPVIGGRGGVERNRIYHSEQQLCWRHKTKCLERLNLGSYTIYYGKSQGVDPTQRIVKWGYHNNGHKDGSNGCIWILLQACTVRGVTLQRCSMLVLNSLCYTRVGNYLILFLQCYMMLHSAIDSMTVIFGRSAFPTRHCQPRTQKGLSALLEREAEIGLRNSAGLRSAENHPPRPHAWA
jgi:hypothetical protein